MSTSGSAAARSRRSSLQDALCGDPCARSIPARWYDGGLTLVYYTHFIAAPLTALVLYLRNRLTWISFMRRYVALYLAGLFFYITYPMAPPWMASRDGYIDGNAVIQTDRSRLVGHRTRALPAGPVASSATRSPRCRRCMPAPLPWWPSSRSRGCAARGGSRSLLYPLAMGFMLVYYGEHYVVDIVAGYLLAGFIMWACANWERGGVLRRGTIAAQPRRSWRPIGPTPSEPTSTLPGVLGWLRRLPAPSCPVCW